MATPRRDRPVDIRSEDWREAIRQQNPNAESSGGGHDQRTGHHLGRRRFKPWSAAGGTADGPTIFAVAGRAFGSTRGCVGLLLVAGI